MKKVLVLAVTAAVLAACAASGSQNIDMLSRKQVGGMTAVEVTSFYKESNAELLNRLLFEKGPNNYDKYAGVFNSMDGELAAMSKVKVTKEEYYQKLENTVNKYRGQIKKIK
ncbi:hypothetical protein FACS189437_03030 [Bacteroidia bacterium]|nr:hypothetical protein FACS189437_03030 [Bacteroidia bacterium]